MKTYVNFPTNEGSAGGSLTSLDEAAPSPAVLFLTPIAGLDPYMSRVADETAKQGFVSLTLDYFIREGKAPDLSDRAKITAAVESLSDPRILADVQAAIDYLQAQPFVDPNRLAVVGFCIGGSYAILSASRFNVFKCAAAFYGTLKYDKIRPDKPISPIDAAVKLSCPLLGHYGEADPLIPLEHVVELRERLKGHPAEVYTYPGAGHAFHEHHRPSVYRPIAAQDAWQRTLAYLRWYMP